LHFLFSLSFIGLASQMSVEPLMSAAMPVRASAGDLHRRPGLPCKPRPSWPRITIVSEPLMVMFDCRRQPQRPMPAPRCRFRLFRSGAAQGEHGNNGEKR
jgi:hypothetical protein